MNANTLKFAFILICALAPFAYGRRVYCARDALFLRLALTLTACADFCLLITNWRIPGVLLFCLVQCTYTARYGGRARAAALLAAWVPLFPLLLAIAPAETAVSAVYAVSFGFSLTSVVGAFAGGKYPFPNNYLTLLGMVLFAICDINVALYNIRIPIFNERQDLIFFIMWSAYLPAQAMLSASGYDYARLRDKNSR